MQRPRVTRNASASRRRSDAAWIASNARPARARIARHVAYADVDAIVSKHCRPNEPGKLRYVMGAGLHTDVWADVHVWREHAHAARCNFSALDQCEHAAR